MFMVYKSDYDETYPIGYFEEEQDAIEYCSLHNKIGDYNTFEELFYTVPKLIKYNKESVKPRKLFCIDFEKQKVVNTDNNREDIVCDEEMIVSCYGDKLENFWIEVLADTIESALKLAYKEIEK